MSRGRGDGDGGGARARAGESVEIRHPLAAAFEAAVEFEAQLARVRAVAAMDGRSFAQLAAEARAMRPVRTGVLRGFGGRRG